MALAKKVLNVMKACRSLTYDSNNDEVGYKYVSAVKVNAAVNAVLVENGKTFDTDTGEVLENVPF